MMDEVFGRGNFVANVVWRKNYSPKSSARHFSEDHDYVTVYAKEAQRFIPNLMPRTERQDSAYKNPDADPRGPWKPSDLSARNFYSLGTYPIITPSGRHISGPPAGRFWSISEENLWRLHGESRIWWGKDGSNVPALKRFLSDVKDGVVPQTWWSYEEVGHTQDAKKEIVSLFGQDVFGTPKPERLIQRILHIATNPGDLVLDSFLGSGTTAAVAHKMGRRWIGIEMGEHAIPTACRACKRWSMASRAASARRWAGARALTASRLTAAAFAWRGSAHPCLGLTEASTPACALPRWRPTSGSKKRPPRGMRGRAHPARRTWV
jgi:adenine-specific DNA-methyltransferase